MKNSSRSSLRWLGAVLVLLGAGALGYFASRALQGGPPEGVVGAMPAVGVAPADAGAGDSAPSAADGEKARRRAIPETLPEITLADASGKPTALSSFANRPLMVNFWATWCAPCRREIPLLNRLRAERKRENVEIVGIAVDFRDDVLQFVKKVPLEYPLLIGEEDGLAAAEAFGMGMAFPFSVFVDSQNRILTVKIGELHEDEANFAFDRLHDIDNGVLTRDSAQTLVADAFRQMAANRATKEAAEGREDHD